MRNFARLSFGKMITDYHIDEAAVMTLFAELGSLKVIVKQNGPVWKEESDHINNIAHQNLGLEAAKFFIRS